MKKRRTRIFPGLVMIFCGILLLIAGSGKKVEVMVNGESRIITTRASRVYDVLEKAGIPVDRDGMSPNLPGSRIITNEPGGPRRQPNPNPNNDRADLRKASDDELGRLSAYTDFLDSLNLDDFGQSNS